MPANIRHEKDNRPGFALSPHVALRRELDVPRRDPVEKWVRMIFLGISFCVFVSIIPFTTP
jgi:hypothetical protein